MTRQRGVRRWKVHLAWLLVAVAAIVVTWAAAREVLTQEEADPVPAPAVATYRARPGEVSETATLTGEVAFDEGPPGVAGTPGTVTSLQLDPRAPITEGDVLATIDLRPVIAAKGEVPAFRDLEMGITGPDVAALRAFLDLPEGEAFDETVEAAVATWQEGLGIEPDGVVRRGDLVFLAQLPTRAYVADGVTLGAEVGPGQTLVVTLQDRANISVTDSLQGRLREGMAAQIDAPDQDPIHAQLGPPTATQDGNTQFSLLDPEGHPACMAECGLAFSVPGPDQVPVSIELTSPATGIVVPDSAVAVQPDGSTAVLRADGVAIPVEVVASAEGMSLVSGLEEGTEVRLFGEQVAP